MIGVYIITFSNNYKYIGSSKDVEERMKQHRRCLKNSKINSWYEDAKQYDILSVNVIPCESIEMARKIEKILIKECNCNLYNTIRYKS